MSDRLIDLTKTYIPVAGVLAVLASCTIGGWTLRGYAKDIEYINTRVDRNEDRLLETVKRDEFNELKNTIEKNQEKNEVSFQKIMEALGLRIK